MISSGTISNIVWSLLFPDRIIRPVDTGDSLCNEYFLYLVDPNCKFRFRFSSYHHNEKVKEHFEYVTCTVLLSIVCKPYMVLNEIRSRPIFKIVVSVILKSIYRHFFKAFRLVDKGKWVHHLLESSYCRVIKNAALNLLAWMLCFTGMGLNDQITADNTWQFALYLTIACPLWPVNILFIGLLELWKCYYKNTLINKKGGNMR